MGEYSQLDYRFMAKALCLAEQGRYSAHPNPMVGCVLVNNGQVVGQGWHRKPGEGHAEIVALQSAAEQRKGATAYVTLEPCCHHGRTGPCTEALIDAGVARVVCAMEDPFPEVAGQGIAKLQQAGIEVEVGLLREQAEHLNRSFLMRIQQGRPFIRCKMAMSLDGRTAAADGSSQWITSAAARCDVHHLRAQSAAIMTGIGTVLHDDPSLTVRAEDEALAALLQQDYFEQPKRVVLDSQFRLPNTAKMLSLPGETWAATLKPHAAFEREELKVIAGQACASQLDLQDVLRQLAMKQINSVLVEAGPTLSGALIEQDLVDELIIYVAPKLLGDGGKALFALPAVQNISQCRELEINDIRAVGVDWRITANIK